MAPQNYELAVIGSGPAGQKAAIAASKLGKKAVVVDRPGRLGGVSLQSGTIPSKTLREGILYFTGFRQRSFYGRSYHLKDDVSVGDLAFRVNTVRTRQGEVVKDQLRRNQVRVIEGLARFADPHTLDIESDAGSSRITAEHILIACGSRPAHNPMVPVDGKKIVDSDQLGALESLPRELIVVGAGVIGLEYASMATALGARVTVIEQRPTILDFADREIVETLTYWMRESGATLRLGETVTGVEVAAEGHVLAHLDSGKDVRGDVLLYCVGRQCNSDRLNLEAAGLSADARGRLTVDEFFRTSVPHIYAAGDVIGFPALASTSMEQGRLAARHMFGYRTVPRAATFPYGIYTIPEISMVGRTEEELTNAKVAYEVGRARYEEIAKAQMLGADNGLLKILFHPQTHEIFGIHAIGDGASEIIHIGQTALALGGRLDYFSDAVFNFPTLAEAYRVAALDGLNKVAASGADALPAAAPAPTGAPGP
jgi:NAD(P) transhydrogenase